jgi:hypothetical protein
LEADRILWDLWARANPRPNGFGGQFQIDGMQAYMMLNHTAVRLGGWAKKKSQPPVASLPATVDTLAVVPNVAAGCVDLTITKLGTGLAADYVEIHIAGQFQSPGRRAVESRFVYLLDIAGNTGTSFVGNLQSDAWYWFRARYVGADGQTSNWVWDTVQPG